MIYKILRPIFQTTNNLENEQQEYYRNQLKHDGMVANTDSKLGLDFGSYPGYNHSTIINNLDYFFENEEHINNTDEHKKAIKERRAKLDFTNPEYLYLNYISVLSQLEGYLETKK